MCAAKSSAMRAVNVVPRAVCWITRGVDAVLDQLQIAVGIFVVRQSSSARSERQVGHHCEDGITDIAADVPVIAHVLIGAGHRLRAKLAAVHQNGAGLVIFERLVPVDNASEGWAA